MVSKYTLPHLDISALKSNSNYKSPNSTFPRRTPFSARQHADKLRAEFKAAYTGFDQNRANDDRIDPANGSFLEVDLEKSTKVTNLDRKSRGIRTGAVTINEDETRTVSLYIPDEQKEKISESLDQFGGWEAGTEGQPTDPHQKNFFKPIQNVRAATLETYWTDDPSVMPQNPDDTIWWEVWLAIEDEEKLDQFVTQLELRAADKEKRLYFYEHCVVPVLGDRGSIEILLFSDCAITELRRASDSPRFYLDALTITDQIEWVQELSERVVWPHHDAPAICLLDTGVNRAHHLIEPTLSANDLNTVNPVWGATDDNTGHGTGMTGLALYGDLIYQLPSQDETVLTHRMESVKIMPPDGFDPTPEPFYGAITLQAIAIQESVNADRNRVFCLAITNENRSGQTPTTWSAAIDQSAAGVSLTEEKTEKRLFFVSAGNVPSEIMMERIIPIEEMPIEDPAQAWNAITVGGYTDKIAIQEPDISDHTPMVDAGELSPFTRTSLPWSAFKTPFKPEIVMEAGNRAVNPNKTEAITPNSLSLLTTGADLANESFTPFNATSAATAQAARLGARMLAELPEQWPEMIRALIIHGAEWTPPMLNALNTARTMGRKIALLRQFGHGVPNFERASASAKNHLALISQSSIQPFKLENGTKSFGECHFYDLPWPKEILETLGEKEVKLKVTLSYFVEPNPGASATIDPYRYQSFGLRFDLKRHTETQTNFYKRTNKNFRTDGDSLEKTDAVNWKFGPNAINAGSLHSDEWTGKAVDLLTRDKICIYPVMGWWRDRASKDICNQQARYALVISLKTDDVEIDLHTRIKKNIELSTEIET